VRPYSSRQGTGPAVAIALGLLALAVHIATDGGYGYFRDELYFIACGEHPAWGYVDQPPLIPLAAHMSRIFFGDSLYALRLLPAVAAALTVGLVCEFARTLGGGRFAQVVAGVATLLAPVYLSFGLLLTTNTLDPLLWTFVTYSAARVVRDDDERWWLLAGIAAGIALEAKYGIAVFLFALFIGVLATGARRSLRLPHIYVGAALATLIALPSIAWQWAYGWPFVELLRAGSSGKNVVLGPGAFVSGQILILEPFAAVVWIAGLGALLFSPVLRPYRFLGVTFVVFVLLEFALHAKAYYPAPAYATLFAAGGVALERWLRPAAVRAFVVGALVLAGLVLAPFALPVLPPAAFIAYERALHLHDQPSEHLAQAELPQTYADMFGWPELARDVARVYRSLPPAERARAAIFTDNYGEAGAIDFFGADLGLPGALSGHNNYFLWGPGPYDGSVLIRVGSSEADLRRRCATVALGALHDAPYAMPYERHLPIWICHGLHPPLPKLWPQLKDYI
jgi:hypothetical protein